MAVREWQQAIDTLYAHTLQNMKPDIQDNVFGATPFFKALTSAGKFKKQEGGRWIEQPLEYADSRSAVAWIGTSHDLSTQVNNAKSLDLVTTGQYYWRYVTGSIYRKFIEEAQNRGKAKLHDLLQTKINNLKSTFAEIFEETLFTLTTPSSDSKIDGLPNIVRDDPNPTASTYTYAEIPQGNVAGSQVNTWWNNQADNMAGVDPTLYLVPRMRTMFNNCSGGTTDVPDLILMSQELFELYEDETGEQKVIVNSNTGDASFQYMKFKGQDLTWSPSCPTDKVYFLNTKYLYLVYDPAIWFELTEWKPGRTDLDKVGQVVCACNLICTNRRRQGVIHSVGVAA